MRNVTKVSQSQFSEFSAGDSTKHKMHPGLLTPREFQDLYEGHAPKTRVDEMIDSGYQIDKFNTMEKNRAKFEKLSEVAI